MARTPGSARRARSASWAVCVMMITGTMVATQTAPAHHAPSSSDESTWIAQAGNGVGESLPVIPNFNVQAVLFDARRFPENLNPGGCSLGPRPGFTKYVAFGTVRRTLPNGTVDPIVAHLSTSFSENGLHWSPPQPAMIREPETGQSAPFLIADPDYFDVVFRPAVCGVNTTSEFRIFYRQLGSDPGQPTSFHTAITEDGVHWADDRAIVSFGGANTTTLVSGNAGDFNAFSAGPTKVVYQPSAPNPGGSACADTDPDGPGPEESTPWNCAWVMLYHTTDGTGPATGRQYVAIAGAGGMPAAQQQPCAPPANTSLCPVFRARPAPILSPGSPGEWDSLAATNARLRVRPDPADPSNRRFEMYYAGASDSAGCVGGTAPCFSIGTAHSSDGLTFTKSSINPATPRTLFDHFTNRPPSSLFHPLIVDDAGQNGDSHSRIYLTRIDNGDAGSLPRRDVFLAYTEPPPTQSPRLAIGSPVGPFRSEPDTPIELYLTDTLGSVPSKIGIDLSSLEMTIDGHPVGGYSFEMPSLVTALQHHAIKVTAPAGALMLEDGTHTFEIRVRDRDGNETTATEVFVVDTTPPSTTITKEPSGERVTKCQLGPTIVGCQFDSIGTFEGETVDGTPTGATGLARIQVTATNPLGEQRTYVLNERLFDKVSPTLWRWRWIAPSADTHFLLPGPYTLTFTGSDIASGVENSSEANTTTVFVL